MAAEELIADTRAVIDSRVATEVAHPYGDRPVFPTEVVIEQPSTTRFFPLWPEPVLLLSHENQGVCSWGVSLGPEHRGRVVAGGKLSSELSTLPYCDDASTFVQARRWDAQCLERMPLLQAQAKPLDKGTYDDLRTRFERGPATENWPTKSVHRFEAADLKILLWSEPRQCYWWLSGPPSGLTDFVQSLPCDLVASLWSNDDEGESLLAKIRSTS